MNNQLSRRISIIFLTSISIFILAVNITMFLKDYDFDIFNYHHVIYDDRQFNYSDVKKVDDYLTTKISFIKNNFDTRKALIIASNRFWQQVMYYFPEARVIHSGQLMGRKGKSGFSLCCDRKCTNIKEDYFRLPPDINTLIIFDDVLIPYLKINKHTRLIRIKDSMDLLVADLKEYSIIEFSENSIVLK